MNRQDYPNNTRNATSDPAARQPYRRHTPHVSQEPINDLESDYVTVDRFEHPMQTGRAASPSRGRKHMGVATSDADYMQEAMPGGAERNYARYLQTPKPGKSIFTARRERKRKTHLIVAAIIAVVVIVALVFFLTR